MPKTQSPRSDAATGVKEVRGGAGCAHVAADDETGNESRICD